MTRPYLAHLAVNLINKEGLLKRARDDARKHQAGGGDYRPEESIPDVETAIHWLLSAASDIALGPWAEVVEIEVEET